MQKLVGLKEFRRDHDLTLEGLARKLGLSLSYVSQIENGHATPAMGFMRRIKAAYPDINIDKIFFDNADKEA